MRLRRLSVNFLAISILGSVAAADAGPLREVPGRVIVKLTAEGAAQLRKGTFLIPVSGPVGTAARPALEPLFPHHRGKLSRYALLTWDHRASAELPGLGDNDGWIRALTRDPHVESAESDGWATLAALPADPYFPQQPHLWNPGGLSLHLAQAWPFVPADGEAVVAVLDSGVDWPHPDLGGEAPVLAEAKGAFWLNQAEAEGQAGVDDDGNGMIDDFMGWDFVDVPSIPSELNAPDAVNGEDGTQPDNDPMDYSGHGTYCAGLVTALTDNGKGLAGNPGVKIMPIRVAYQYTTSWGSGVAYYTWYTQGLVYAADAGADVASCSFHTDFYPEILADAVNYAVYDKGMSIVNAAGNYSSSNIDAGQAYMASQPEVIAVAGLNPNGRKWSGSNFGEWVNIAAFAWGSHSTYQVTNQTNYSYLAVGQGTSWSCPMVAGGVALLRQAAPELSPLEVMDALVTTGQDLSQLEPTYADRLGGGLADFSAAMEAVGGGWHRALSAVNLTPMDDGLLAVASEGEVRVLDAATAEEAFSWKGDPLPVLPCVLRQGEEQYLAFASGSPQDFSVHVVDASGAALPGWPQEVASEPTALTVVDWAPGREEALVTLTGTDLSVWALDGSLLDAQSGFDVWGIAVGDFNTDVPGLEVAGFAQGQVLVRSSEGLVTHLIPELQESTVPPVAVGLGDGSLLAFAAQGSSVMALDNASVLRLGFPVELGAAVQHLSIEGRPDGSVYAVATDAAGFVHRIDAQGAVTSWQSGGSVSGDPLVADLDGNYQPDLVLSLADGTLSARRGDWTRTAGLPRRFPAALVGAPVVLDHPQGRRYLAAMDEDGRVWSLPFAMSGQDRPLVWSAARGSSARTGTVAYDRATPVETAVLHWEWNGESRGTLCWDTVERYAAYVIVTERETRRLEGELSCGEVTGVRPGQQVELSALPRNGGPPRHLGTLRLPAFVTRVLSAAPNPFRSALRLTFPPVEPGAELEVFDLRGRLVRREPLATGSRAFEWDGKTLRGAPAPPGVYFARLSRTGGAGTVKLIKSP